MTGALFVFGLGWSSWLVAMLVALRDAWRGYSTDESDVVRDAACWVGLNLYIMAAVIALPVAHV